MFAGWRHAYANMALTGGNLVFLLIALKSPTPAGASLAAGLVGVTSLYAWHANLRRYSAVADTPTSRIASAPQGYVEIVGRGVHLPGARLVSPISGLPCLWYRYISEEKKGNKWHRVDSGISAEEFGLDDGNSIAVIDPDGAAIVAPKKRGRTNGHYRHTEWSLIEGEPLYVLGEHVTIGGANADLDFRQAVSELLGDWKRDKPGLLMRFDRDGSGDISLEEWESARKAAQNMVARQHREARLEQGMHLMRKPNGRLYLIANSTPEHLVSRYRFWAWAHLALIASACLTVVGLL